MEDEVRNWGETLARVRERMHKHKWVGLRAPQTLTNTK